MRLIIEIPDEFTEQFAQDRFEDSLRRLSADAHSVAGNYEQETALMLIDAFKNGTPIQTVTNAEEAEAYPIAENIPISKEEQAENCRIVREFLRDVAHAKDLPTRKE